MISRNTGRLLVVVLMSISLPGAWAVPWDVFVDPDSGSACDVVNAADDELVVWSDTGQLVLISGVDVVLVDTFVDDDWIVYYFDDPVGLISFEEDADGFLTLWWLSFTGWVIEVDPFTLEPLETDLLPSHFVDVPCDACEFWDDPADCIIDDDLDDVDDLLDECLDTPLDEQVDVYGCSWSQLDDDLDGIENGFDQCPGTPLDDPEVDLDGCSWSQLDDDLDGIENGFDLCPGTPLDDPEVDLDGCSWSQLDTVIAPPPVVSVSACGATGTVWLTMTLCGLVGLKLSRRP
jgi:hypothetical protein